MPKRLAFGACELLGPPTGLYFCWKSWQKTLITATSWRCKVSKHWNSQTKSSAGKWGGGRGPNPKTIHQTELSPLGVSRYRSWRTGFLTNPAPGRDDFAWRSRSNFFSGGFRGGLRRTWIECSFIWRRRHEMPSQRFYPDRVAGGDCDHRDPHR